ncbi:MAG: cytochrome c oxidase subunit II [Bdellovibrio sp.]
MNFSIFPPAASTYASDVDHVGIALFVISLFLTVGIFGTLFIFSLKYRHTQPHKEDVVKYPTILKIELAWTFIPLAIMLGLFVWGLQIFIKAVTPPPKAAHVFVVAKQWMWKFEHQGGESEINTVHVPLGFPVELDMISNDVVHSFFVPAFRLKQDVLPGQYTHFWFQATQLGTFDFFCSQYCGTNHSEMVGKVIVMKPDEYNLWLNNQNVGTLANSTSSPVEAGKEIYNTAGCSACHDKGIGPDLHGVFGAKVILTNGQTVTADANYIRESILLPNAKIVKGFSALMPTFQGQLTEEQILSLIAYIQSLGPSSQEKK